jgi:hypothetical protein
MACLKEEQTNTWRQFQKKHASTPRIVEKTNNIKPNPSQQKKQTVLFSWQLQFTPKFPADLSTNLIGLSA